jgi:hypothetical protein
MLWLLFLACLGITVAVGLGVKRLRRWFLVSGCLGVLVALTLMTIASHYVVRPTILLVLWPSSIYGFANPSTLPGIIMVALFEFGGNFILYGVIGTLIGLCFPRKPSPEGLGAR